MLKPHSASSKSQRCACLMILSAALVFSASCEEQKQVSGEALTLKTQLGQIQSEESAAEDELKRLVIAIAAVKENLLIRKSGSMMEQKKDTLSSEVSALQARKAQLEKEIEAFNKTSAGYRQKYL